ncbi:hypothetical protein SGM_5103 [Streptomyces griseoaurantiacus M045]|jgi:hypothetical protein|uniref:Uncharacterized protein n=1 Tax=Streptomyces griseoaurantiacus M045 TaxID=996637 RepID=F3NQ28_9ACTN|nr:hypothetical protein SGM_5103 [Streptomyces griseoaurantiacus M045]
MAFLLVLPRASSASSDFSDLLVRSDESREFDAWDVFDMATS